MRLGELLGEHPRTACLDQLTRTRDRRRVERACGKERSKLRRLEPFTAQCRAHGQCLLPLGEVAAHRLAGHLRIAPDAEDVVERLECNAEMTPVTFESFDDVRCRAGKYRADRRCKGQQRTGLA